MYSSLKISLAVQAHDHYQLIQMSFQLHVTAARPFDLFVIALLMV